VRETFEALHELGFWPVLIYPPGVPLPSKPGELAKGKEPIGKAWGAERWTPDKALARLKEYPAAGVGMCFGPGRAPGGGWLIDVEGDGPEAEESRLKLFDGEDVVTMGWPSARGRHQVLTVDPDRLSGLLAPLKGLEGKGIKAGVYHLPEFPGLEIRFGGYKGGGVVKQVQSVCPPTAGTDGRPRVWNGVGAVADAPESLYRALAAAAAAAAPAAGPGPTRKPRPPKSKPEAGADDDRPQPRRLNDVALAADALRFLGKKYHNEYQPWLEVGFALRELGQAGLALWDQWSAANRAKYEPGACQAKWGTMAAGGSGGISLGSLFHWAEQEGWKRPRPVTPPADAGPGPAGDAPAGRAEIEVNTERHRVLEETLAALPADPDLYRRGDVLARVNAHAGDALDLPGGVTLRNAAGLVRVVPVQEAGLSCRLTAIVDFYSVSADKNGEPAARPAHPPTWLVRAVREHGSYPGLRPLRGVAEAPFPRPDGSLVTTPGYDPATGVFCWPSVAAGPLPDAPTRADAEAAARALLAPVRQFPFASEDDRAVWLADTLTMIARAGIDGPVPGFAYNANKPGAGKGKLIDAGATVATGRPVPTTSYPRDTAEAAKLKTALALAATPVVHLDNLGEGQTYGGDALDSALTSTEVNERILGESRSTGPVELRCCWHVSGNNIAPAKDAHRRWLVCNLVTELERPEERDDLEVPDLLAYVRQRRAEYVRAALVILRAHALAGYPNGGWAPLGSFEEWDRVIRGAVWFATGRDCNATRRKAADEAPDRLAKLALLEAWAELPQGGPDGLGVTSEEAHRLAADQLTTGNRDHPLAVALMRFSRDGKLPDVRRIGFTVRGMKGQNFEGRAFATVGTLRNSAQWRVSDVGPRLTATARELRELRESIPAKTNSPRDGRLGMKVCGGQPEPCSPRLEMTRATRATHNGPGLPDTPEPADCGGCLRLDCRQCNPPEP
jgi:hypothetical protein